MKKLIFIGLFLSLIIAAGCGKSAKDKVIGKWKLKSVEGQNLSAEELNSVIILTDDGKFSLTSGENKEKEGTWEMSKDEKSISAKNKDGETEVWNIQKLEDKEFIFTVGKDKEKITMEKI